MFIRKEKLDRINSRIKKLEEKCSELESSTTFYKTQYSSRGYQGEEQVKVSDVKEILIQCIDVLGYEIVDAPLPPKRKLVVVKKNSF